MQPGQATGAAQDEYDLEDEPPKCDFSVRPNLDFKFVAFHQFHADQRLGIGFIDQQLARFSVPNHGCNIDVEQANAAIGSHAPSESVPL